MLLTTLLLSLALPAFSTPHSKPHHGPSGVPSKGCTSRKLPAGLSPGAPSTNHTINVYGQERSYLLYIPQDYIPGTPAPLYLSYAGATRNASQQEYLSQLSNPFFNTDGIAVYPQGLNNFWLSNPRVPNTFPNDIDFTLVLLDALEESLCIDTTRVYASGKSNGGGFTNLLACNATTAARFAAFASVSGAYYRDELATTLCDPGKQPVPFLEFHGLNDTTVPYYGKDTGVANASEPAIPLFLNEWAVREGCRNGTKPAEKDGLFPMGLVDRLSWSCAGFKDVLVHYREDDLGHIWPSTVIPNEDCELNPAQCPMGKYTFNATGVILDFYKRWTLPR